MKSKSDSKSLELSASKDSKLTYKNQHQQDRSMSLSRSSEGRRTHATPDEFDLMRLSTVEQHEHEHNKRPQRSYSKPEVIIKDCPKGSGKGKDDDDDGFKCSAFCMCMPGFGNKAKKAVVKARKRETKMDHHPVDPMMMSSTFSFEIFERNSGIANENNKEDESISSYFELPLSQMFKYNGDDAQSPVIAAFVLDNKDIKGERL